MKQCRNIQKKVAASLLALVCFLSVACVQPETDAEYENRSTGGLAGNPEAVTDDSTGRIIVITEKEVILPVAEFSVGYQKEWGGFVQNGEHYYYQGEHGMIYQASVADPANRSVVLQLLGEAPDVSEACPVTKLWVENGETYLRFRSGEAVIGHDEQYLLTADGSCTQIEAPASSFSYKKEGDMELFNCSYMGGVCAFYKYKEDAEHTQIRWDDKSLAAKYAVTSLGNETVIIVGEERQGQTWTGKPYFYKHDIKTGEKEKICDLYVLSWQVSGHEIYFYGQDESIYKLPVNGGNPEKLGDAVVNANEMAVVNGTVFYKDFSGSDLYMLGQAEPVVKGGVSTFTKQDGYLKIEFYESPYRYMILDENGKEAAKTTEDVVDLYIHNGQAIHVKTQ